jgi:hypothetical protein
LIVASFEDCPDPVAKDSAADHVPSVRRVEVPQAVVVVKVEVFIDRQGKSDDLG